MYAEISDSWQMYHWECLAEHTLAVELTGVLVILKLFLSTNWFTMQPGHSSNRSLLAQIHAIICPANLINSFI